MDNNSCLKSFTCNIKEFVIDEIALEGLEGIGLDLLWRRLELRLSAPVLKKMQIRFWNIILSVEAIKCYQLPVPAPNFELVDRFHNVHPESGQLLELPDYVDGPYEYWPTKDNYGSCMYYDTRKLISKDDLRTLLYEEVVTQYGNSLVLVASIEERWRALASHMPISCLYQMATMTYCVLELVGKSRKNGQMTCGKTNLTKIEKDPKMLFYYRKLLQELNLVTVQNVIQYTGGRSVSSIFLRLKRFYEPCMMNIPKEGRFFQLIKHLSEHPDLSDSTEAMIKKGILTPKESKKLIKTNFFNIESREISQKDSTKKTDSNKSNTKRYLCLVPQSDESSHSEDEDLEEQIPSQYNIKRNVVRQAYEAIANAGIRGLSMYELAQFLGIEFYMMRTIIRLFMRIKIVRQFYTEKGKHKVARYIAATVTATDSRFEEEKQKLLNFLGKDQIESTITESASTSAIEITDSEAEIPKKRLKLDDNSSNDDDDDKVIAESITQIDLIEGYEKFKNKNLLEKSTLRQLKYANGILEILKEYKVILGFVTLNWLVSKLINEPRMCTKTIKACVQTLTSNGQAKVFHLKWPGSVSKISVLICDPHVSPNDTKIKSIYKEIYFKSIKNNTIKEETSKNVSKAMTYLSVLSYKRYTKAQKLHEFLMKVIYFNDDDDNKNQSGLPKGYSSIVDIIPELSVELAIRITTKRGLMNISKANIPNSMYQEKLKDVPKNIFRLFVMQSALQAACMMNLKLLSLLGLVQIIEEFKTDTDNKIRISNIFYLNRRASLINTSGSWPIENVDKTLIQSYEFKNMQVVRRYWQDVYNISTSTNVNVPPKERYRKVVPKICSQKNEVEANDNGKVFGNGLGPCGFDGSVYMDIPRFWSNPKSTLGITMKKLVRLKSLRTRIKKQVVGKTPVVASTEKKKLTTSQPKTRIAKLTWTAQEDKIILLCSAAVSIISPLQTRGSLNLRNVVAKDIVSLIDKTKMLPHIHKRAVILDSISCLKFERDFLVNEVKRRQSFMQKYYGLFRKSKLKHFGVLAKTIASCRLPMMELVWILFQISTSDVFNKKFHCIAGSIDEFNTKFTISPVATSGDLIAYKTTSSDPTLALIKECIILCLISYRTAVDKKLTNKIYATLKSYPESQMRQAVDDLRKCNILVLRDKRIVLKSSSPIDSSFKISEMYLRRWSSRFNTDFVDNMASIFNDEIPSTIKGAPETICAFLELHSCDAVDLQMETVPSINSVTGNFIQDEQLSVSDIFSNHKLKSGVVGLRNKTNFKRFSELFDNLEINDALRKIISNSEIEDSEQDVEGDNKIVSHLNEKQASGSTFEELQNITGYDVSTLKNKLQELEGARIIKRVGFFENVVVLSKFLKAWSLQANDVQFIPAPWFNVQMDFSYEVFFKWAGKVMDKVFRHPGCSVEYITRICQMISARSVQDICEFLQSILCVTLSYVVAKEPDLFSDDEIEPEITEYNPFGAMKHVLVFPVKNSLVNFTYVINKFKEYGASYYENVNVNNTL